MVKIIGKYNKSFYIRIGLKCFNKTLCRRGFKRQGLRQYFLWDIGFILHCMAYPKEIITTTIINYLFNILTDTVS